jgi:lipopolysaccharide cholinephosphotransferase
MNNISTSELKKIQLGILKIVHQYCEENSITYFLCYGTLIGAIRHKGFMPWDDDIDIMMPRPDYEKFIKEFNSYCSEDYFVYSHEYHKDYAYPFAKISNEKTIIIENVNAISIGINIDLFPIDGLPYNERRSKNHISYISIFKKLLYWKLINSRHEYKWYKNIIIKILHASLYLIPQRILSQKLTLVAKKIDFEGSDFVGCVVWGYGHKERFNKELYSVSVMCEFENFKFRTLIGYDKYLKNLYGDYMQLPPINERVSHHAFSYAYWK